MKIQKCSISLELYLELTRHRSLHCLLVKSMPKRKKSELREAAKRFLCSMYSMNSKSSNVEAVKLYQDLSSLWGRADMYKRKWISNSVVVSKQIPEEDKAA